MRRALAIALVCTAQLVAPSPVAAQPDWGRPLTPEEGRRLNSTISTLSNQLRVRRATLVSIARALGVSLRTTSFERLIQLVAEKAQEAAALQARLADLERQLESLPASAAVSEA